MTRLQDLIDSHGGDIRRWPIEDREPMNTLLRQEPAARALLDQAAALDQILAAAPRGNQIDTAALTERIVASARLAAVPPVASDQPSRPKLVLVPGRAARPRPVASYWPAMAALAASLVIGFYAGMSGWAPAGLQQAAGLSTDVADTSLNGTLGTADDQPAEGIL